MSEKRGFGDFVDRVTSVAAIITAVAALGIAVYEARITREQQKKTVWPYVMQYNSNANGEYSRSVENVGLGPALVRSFVIHVNDSLYARYTDEIRREDSLHHPWRPIVHALTGYDSIYNIYSNLGDGSVLRAGERFKVLRIPPGAGARAFYENRDEFHTTVCYCSLYGDCWLSDSKENQPRSVDSCEEGTGGTIQADSGRDSTRAQSEGAGR